MATIKYTIVDQGPGFEVIRWTLLAAGDVGQAYIPDSYFSDRSVQITGTLTATSSTLAIKGSNFGKDESSPTFHALADPLGTALSFTADQTASHQILENTRQIRPELTSGSATSIVVRLLVSTQK